MVNKAEGNQTENMKQSVFEKLYKERVALEEKRKEKRS